MSAHEHTELQSLVKMANQIAANFSFHEDGADRMLSHLQRFWAPSMRQMMMRHVEAGGAGLDDLALQVARRLKA
jgi:formate dehydrogenase subunit delta